ncbi:hypothetical protein LTR05_005582 [Lithohypha guttulata]|uniref:Major facilitator superfamily (MFS) profile domain-containing protein n=1 Tax=Lithohypha guttulata TaxID=1690604 RepID=A0AAN7SYD7_9EURO|nr:hypothetical protein LTR05_005582 [Lithohypha guttulata]
MSVFPYSYKMIEWFGITQNVSTYAGMLITAFAFAEFSTGMLWGRVSDRFGRKPVLIMGLVGTALSMICFGFSKNLWSAIVARALGGLLNGNVGVLQTTVAELVKKKEHQPRAYSIMPFVWCLGSIIGPAMAGALAMPCQSYPTLFPPGGLFEEYPFLLPNLVCVVVLVFGILNGILFIEETHPERKHERDRGREIGEFLLTKLCGEACGTSDHPEKVQHVSGSINKLDHRDPPPGYRSTESSPLLCSSPAPQLVEDTESGQSRENRSFDVTFSRQVILVILGYGILAFHSVSFDSLMPVMLSEPSSSQRPILPFKFTGGFGMTPKTIGFMMAFQGVYSMIAQLWFFPAIVKKVGTLGAFRSVMIIWPVLYFLVPYLVLLPTNLQTIGIYAALLTKITFHVIAFPSNAILLANAAPSKSVLGTINGAAASTACLCRAFGPTISGSIHSAGLHAGYNGFAWWLGGIICAIGAVEAYCIQDTDGCKENINDKVEDQTVCEPLMVSSVDEPNTKIPSNTIIDDLDLNVDVKLEQH